MAMTWMPASTLATALNSMLSAVTTLVSVPAMGP